MEKILSKIEKQPDIIINRLIDEFSLPVSEAALSKRLKKAGLTYEKKIFYPKGQERQDVVEKRNKWRNWQTICQSWI